MLKYVDELKKKCNILGELYTTRFYFFYESTKIISYNSIENCFMYPDYYTTYLQNKIVRNLNIKLIC